MLGGFKFYEGTPQNKRIKGGGSGKVICTWGWPEVSLRKGHLIRLE